MPEGNAELEDEGLPEDLETDSDEIKTVNENE
jgi:hypothetical protein